jgi:aspartyl aminopeptidase
MIVASHSDSPSFRVKTSFESAGAYNRLSVEKYGGMIHYTWLDRPLSVAGRVVLRTEGGIEERLVNLDKDSLVIPSVAIHLNRGVNDGAKHNPAVDLIPLAGIGKDASVERAIADMLSVKTEDIISHDLFVYNRDGGKVCGVADDLILSPRLDDLECVHSSLRGFLDSEKNPGAVKVLAVFDNEEVGSETKQGAASSFLHDVLRRIAGSEDNYYAMLENSFMISADNAHALHPNHPELSDKDNAPILGSGVVIKHNGNQRYTTDGVSDAILRAVADKAGIKTQHYYNRADLPGGSTLGSIATTKVSLSSVDIGLAQLAMHSANETASTSDYLDMEKLMCAFYTTYLVKQGNKTEIK